MAMTLYGQTLSPAEERFADEMLKRGMKPKEILRLLQHSLMVNPSFTGSPKSNIIQAQPAPREWKHEPPMTYDAMSNELTPVGALYLRLGVRGGNALPAGVRHISAHVVQPIDQKTFRPMAVEKAFVFVVNDAGEAITLEDPSPTLFPSDTLVLQVKMIMEGSALKPGEVRDTQQPTPTLGPVFTPVTPPDTSLLGEAGRISQAFKITP